MPALLESQAARGLAARLWELMVGTEAHSMRDEQAMLPVLRVRCSFGLAMAAVLATGLAGCDAASSLAVAVRGSVTYQRVPVPTGLIVFTPDPSRGGSGPMARAELQRDGSYDLRTDDIPGTYPGWYRVTVVAVEPSCDDRTPGRSVANAYPAPGFAIPRSLLPEKYRDPELSGLTCEVQPGRVNQIDFHLE
jgi:hypothetical protein